MEEHAPHRRADAARVELVRLLGQMLRAHRRHGARVWASAGEVGSTCVASRDVRYGGVILQK